MNGLDNFILDSIKHSFNSIDGIGGASLVFGASFTPLLKLVGFAFIGKIIIAALNEKDFKDSKHSGKISVIVTVLGIILIVVVMI